MELIPRSFGSDFVRVTQHTYRAEINRIKRVFSALKPQNTQMERNLDSGSMLNIDRIIQAQIEGVFGSVDSKPYLAHKKTKRSISVSFLIDLSSSTNEIVGVSGKRIIDIQKEAIVLISEALHSVGDLFSIYGFSGYGRDQVAIYRVKEEGEEWNEITQQRLGNLSWRMENRDGAAIRHVTDIVRKGEGKIKLLFLISDGRPLDCGCSLYHDSYAQADTRAALLNARNHGVQPFCITVDPGGADYHSDMYGQSFVVIKEVEALPMQLPLLYRRFIQ
jgi:nitric oxide reductase activation protein